jgi:hypothetical protein
LPVIIFNLKHGIELFLKALIMRTDSNEEYSQSHNLIELLNTEISIMKRKKVDNNAINILDKNVRFVIEKYYYGLYAFSKNNNNPDINNEAERYPEHRNKNCYEIKNLWDVVDGKLIEEIMNDCRDIQKNLRNNVFFKII